MNFSIFPKKITGDQRTIKHAQTIGRKIFLKFYIFLDMTKEQRLYKPSHLEQIETGRNIRNKHFSYIEKVAHMISVRKQTNKVNPRTAPAFYQEPQCKLTEKFQAAV